MAMRSYSLFGVLLSYPALPVTGVPDELNLLRAESRSLVLLWSPTQILLEASTATLTGVPSPPPEMGEIALGAPVDAVNSLMVDVVLLAPQRLPARSAAMPHGNVSPPPVNGEPVAGEPVEPYSLMLAGVALLLVIQMLPFLSMVMPRGPSMPPVVMPVDVVTAVPVELNSLRSLVARELF